MSPPEDQRPLLHPTPTGSSYGATGQDVGYDSTRAATPPQNAGEEVKQNKKFREIWPLCLGLWTACVLPTEPACFTRLLYSLARIDIFDTVYFARPCLRRSSRICRLRLGRTFVRDRS